MDIWHDLNDDNLIALLNQNLSRSSVTEYCKYCKNRIKKHYWRKLRTSRRKHIIRLTNHKIFTLDLLSHIDATINYKDNRDYYTGICKPCNDQRTTVLCEYCHIELQHSERVHCKSCLEIQSKNQTHIPIPAVDIDHCSMCNRIQLFCTCRNINYDPHTV